jgi:hypothetical protein
MLIHPMAYNGTDPGRENFGTQDPLCLHVPIGVDWVRSLGRHRESHPDDAILEYMPQYSVYVYHISSEAPDVWHTITKRMTGECH